MKLGSQNATEDELRFNRRPGNGLAIFFVAGVGDGSRTRIASAGQPVCGELAGGVQASLMGG